MKCGVVAEGFVALEGGDGWGRLDARMVGRGSIGGGGFGLVL